MASPQVQTIAGVVIQPSNGYPNHVVSQLTIKVDGKPMLSARDGDRVFKTGWNPSALSDD